MLHFEAFHIAIQDICAKISDGVAHGMARRTSDHYCEFDSNTAIDLWVYTLARTHRVVLSPPVYVEHCTSKLQDQ